MTFRPLALLLLLAAAPAGVDPNGPVARWVQGWKDANGAGCCGIESDCRPTGLRPSSTSPSGWEAWIDRETYGATAPDAWMPVPKSAFSEGSRDNPTGVSWACWYALAVRCAALGSGF